MQNRRLPLRLIIRNVLISLLAWMGLLLLLMGTRTSMQNQSQPAESLQRLFLYRMALEFQGKQ